MDVRTFVTLFFIISSASAAFVGGISETEKAADSEVQGYIDATSGEIKVQTLNLLASGDSKPPSNLFDNEIPRAISYRTQLVSGNNYFIKTKIGNYIFHVRLYRDLENKLSFTSVIGPKTAADPIKYF